MKKKRYCTEKELLDAIEHEYSRLSKARAEAWRLDRLSIIENGLCPSDEDALRRYEKICRRIEDVKLPKLKHGLAAFRTQLMPFTDDPAVVLT